MNFAPRVRQPVLTINGRHDFVQPVETAQKPLFDLLGSPADPSVMSWSMPATPSRATS